MITIKQYREAHQLATSMQGTRDHGHPADSFATPTFSFSNELYAAEFAGYVSRQLGSLLTTEYDGLRTVTVRG
jgi:hypothetical protein